MSRDQHHRSLGGIDDTPGYALLAFAQRDVKKFLALLALAGLAVAAEGRAADAAGAVLDGAPPALRLLLLADLGRELARARVDGAGRLRQARDGRAVEAAEDGRERLAGVLRDLCRRACVEQAVRLELALKLAGDQRRAVVLRLERADIEGRSAAGRRQSQANARPTSSVFLDCGSVSLRKPPPWALVVGRSVDVEELATGAAGVGEKLNEYEACC
jgi:hypothetical protein